ncbi:MAG: molybdopterin-dependent oxidoreductase [Gemmatimonadales bacterium]
MNSSRPFSLALALLVAAQALRAQATPTMPGGYAPAVELGGLLDHPARLDSAALARLPATELTMADGHGASADSARYRGVLLWELIRQAGPQTDSARKGDLLRDYVVVTGSDGYQVTVAMGEILPDFGAQPIILAWLRNGEPLDSAHGMAQLLVPGDHRRGRSVHNVARIEFQAPGR